MLRQQVDAGILSPDIPGISLARRDDSVIIGFDGALDAKPAEFRRLLEVNVLATYDVLRLAVPHLVKSAEAGRDTCGLATSSVASLRPYPGLLGYCTSKAAVVGLTKSVAADYVGRGIRCNAIAPGTVDTPSLADRINSYEDPVEARKNFVARQPMGRLAQAHEIAPIVVYLASDESVFASGQVFAVDGGMTI